MPRRMFLLGAWLLVLGCEPVMTVVGAPQVSSSVGCPSGEWPNEDGLCVPAEMAFTAPGATTYWVDQRHPQADDANLGTRARPWRTISRATTVLQPGDAVLVRAGIYRETITPRIGGAGPKRRITYAVYPGDTVIVTGADPANDGWVREGGAWRRAWTGPPLPSYHGENDPLFRREVLIADEQVLRPVYQEALLRHGSFLTVGTDESSIVLVARFPSNKEPGIDVSLEVAQRTHLFRPLGIDPEPTCGDPTTPGWLRLIGFTFRHAANRAQWGAVCAGSVGALVEDVTVEWTNGAGIDASGRNHQFLRVASNDHGQIGWVGSCTGCLFEDTEAVGNNWKGHDPAWEAGGGKWTNTRQTVWRRHRALGNDGPGLWLDGDNDANTVEGSLLRGNALAGLMLELATTHTLVQHNLITETRWLGYSGAGVLSQAASHNAFVHNTIIGNEGHGLWLRLDPERRAMDGHALVANNLIFGNATTATEEAREIQIEGESLVHARSNRLDGNGYGRHARNDLRTSTFFFRPDAASPADFRSGDLARWRHLTAGDAHAQLFDSTYEITAAGLRLPEQSRDDVVEFPDILTDYGALMARPQPHRLRGADLRRVAGWERPSNE